MATSIYLTNPLGGGSANACSEDLSVNVKCYGATGNSRIVTDGVTTNLSTTVTSATAAFTSADLGQSIWGVTDETETVGTTRLPLGIITEVNSATSVTASVAATSSGTGVRLVIGPDDTAGLQAAFAAAITTGRAIYIPAGVYQFKEAIANWSAATVRVPAVRGDGPEVTRLMVRPDFTWSTVANGYAVTWRYPTDSEFAVIAELSLDGNAYNFSTGNSYTPAFAVNGTAPVVHNVRVQRWHRSGGGFYGLEVNGAGGVLRNEAVISNYRANGVGSIALLISNGQGAQVHNFEAHGCGQTFVVDSGQKYVRFFGGTIGDANLASEVRSTADATFNGTRFYGVPATPLTVTGTATFYECTFNTGTNDISGTNATGFSVASGGVARLYNSEIRSFNSGVWINNSGTVYDFGGNTYTAVSGSGGFTTKAPVGYFAPVAFSLVPTASAANRGWHMIVSDAATAAWADTISGGGANTVQAYSNGTNWTVSAK